jgi:hypothetical protein
LSFLFLSIYSSFSPRENNMQRVAIVTDGISSITQQMGQEYGIHVMPVYVMFGATTYRDGIDLHPDQFYGLLRGAEQLPTTSQPTVVDFAELYTDLSSHTEAIVSIHASKKMSATMDSAQAAVLQRPDVPIHVIDCRNISMGQGLLAIAAARASAAGQDAGQIVQLVESLMPRTHLIFTVETLEYLRKGDQAGVGPDGGTSRVVPERTCGGVALRRARRGESPGQRGGSAFSMCGTAYRRSRPYHRHPRRSGHPGRGVLHRLMFLPGRQSDWREKENP